MKIEANEELFTNWRALGERVKSNGSIVQNSISIPEENIAEFALRTSQLQNELRDLFRLTMNHISGGTIAGKG